MGQQGIAKQDTIDHALRWAINQLIEKASARSYCKVSVHMEGGVVQRVVIKDSKKPPPRKG